MAVASAELYGNPLRLAVAAGIITPAAHHLNFFTGLMLFLMMPTNSVEALKVTGCRYVGLLITGFPLFKLFECGRSSTELCCRLSTAFGTV